MNIKDTTQQWYAMRVTYRRELLVKCALDEKGITSFIPMRIVERTINARKIYERVPAVSNLIFVRSSAALLQEVKKHIPSLQYMVDGRTREKLIIPDRDMDNFISLVENDGANVRYLDSDNVNLSSGKRVRIIGGAFDGYEGLLIKLEGIREKQVVVEVKGLLAVTMASVSREMIKILK